VIEDWRHHKGDAVRWLSAWDFRFSTKRGGSTRLIIVCAVSGLVVVATLVGLFLPHLPDKPGPVKDRVQLLGEKQVETATVIFEKGSNLTHFVREHYGRVNPTILDLVLEANPTIADINRIPINKGIVMPLLSKESFVLSIPDKPFTIHLGTYDHRPSLGVIQDAPPLKGKTVEIVVRNISPKERWYRVIAGPFATREEAVKVLSALRDRGIPLEFDSDK
jgi:phage tail protein X